MQTTAVLKLIGWQREAEALVEGSPLTIISAPRASGKSWLGLSLCQQEAERGKRTGFISHTDLDYRYLLRDGGIHAYGGGARYHVKHEEGMIITATADNARFNLLAASLSLLVVDNITHLSPEFMASIANRLGTALHQTRIVLLGGIPEKVSYKSSAGELWAHTAFEQAGEYGWASAAVVADPSQLGAERFHLVRRS